MLSDEVRSSSQEDRSEADVQQLAAASVVHHTRKDAAGICAASLSGDTSDDPPERQHEVALGNIQREEAKISCGDFDRSSTCKCRLEDPAGALATEATATVEDQEATTVTMWSPAVTVAGGAHAGFESSRA